MNKSIFDETDFEIGVDAYLAEHNDLLDNYLDDFKEFQMESADKPIADPFYTDMLFLMHFVTSEMQRDLPQIAVDFLKHEINNLDKYEKVVYLDTSKNTGDINEYFERNLLNMMMNAVNSGSQYARDLFLYLHKTYYKKEYKQLKRFSSISYSELVLLLDSTDWDVSAIGSAHYLTICRLYGIEINRDCNFLYEFSIAHYKKYIEESGDEYDEDDIIKLEKAIDEREEQDQEEIRRLFENDDRMHDDMYEYSAFLSDGFRLNGFPDDLELYGDGFWCVIYDLTYTLSLLRQSFPNKHFTKEELVFATLASIMQETFVNSTLIAKRIFNNVFGLENTKEETLFDPAAVNRSPVQKNTSIVNKKTESGAGNNTDGSQDADIKALTKQIEELYRTIHAKDSEIKHLYEEVKGYGKAKEEIEKLKSDLESQRKELSALREHVYELTEDDIGSKSVSVEEMKEYLNKKKTIIIGGHPNWVSKMKQMFPKWTYVEPQVGGTLESSVVDNADYVYFFTDTLAHTTYNRYMSIVRSHNLDFGYIHGVNIEQTIKKLYIDLENDE